MVATAESVESAESAKSIMSVVRNDAVVLGLVKNARDGRCHKQASSGAGFRHREHSAKPRP